MEFTSKCPKCEESNDFGIDLREIMERMTTPDFSTPVTIGDVIIHFKPLSYKEQNDNNTAQFQDQKMLEALPSSDMAEEEKIKLLQQAFNNVSLLTLNAIADSISMIKTGDDVVVLVGASSVVKMPSEPAASVVEVLSRIIKFSSISVG